MRTSTAILISIAFLALILMGFIFLAYDRDEPIPLLRLAPTAAPNLIAVPPSLSDQTQTSNITQEPGSNQNQEPYIVSTNIDETNQTQAITPDHDGLVASAPASTRAQDQSSAKSSNESQEVSSPIRLSNGFAKLPPAKQISHRDFQNDKAVIVIVDKKNTQTYVLQEQNGGIYIVYESDNAIGTSESPTPPGPYTVESKTTQPTWVPPKSIDPDQKEIGPYKNNKDNPLGIAAIRLNKWNIVLHGTNNPDSIGKRVSHGCIRHLNDDILRIYDTVDEGTKVIVTDSIQGTKIDKSMFQLESLAKATRVGGAI